MSDSQPETLRIGLLVSHLRQDEKMILQAADRLGAEVVVLRDRDILLDLSNPQPPQVDFVLDRCVAHTRGDTILNVFHSWGIPTINSSYSAAICNDKVAMSASLAVAGVPALRTAVAFSTSSAMEAGERLGYPLVIKPVSGSWGRLLARANSPDALASILAQKTELGSLQHGIFYLQEYVDKPGRDIRVFIVGDGVIGATYRTAPHWITNVARGAVSTVCPVTSEIDSLSLAAANAVGAEIAGVDLIETPEGLKVIEVNSGVEFQGLASAVDVPVADVIVEYVLKQGLGIRDWGLAKRKTSEWIDASDTGERQIRSTSSLIPNSQSLVPPTRKDPSP